MKLSIITINYNNRNGLRKTIESVVAQTTRDFEYIIIDGGSTDGSVDVIKEYADYIDYWVSEPDKGIYNAMNKGVAVAHGEYCQFLNSGDWLYDCHVINDIDNLPFCEDMLIGRLMCIGVQKSRLNHPVPNDISFLRFYCNGLPHQSIFIKRSLLVDNPYDETLKIVSDWKFFIETLIFKNCSYRLTSRIIAFYPEDGISATQTENVAKERTQVVQCLLPQRIISDYTFLDEDMMSLAKALKPYTGFKRLIIKFCLRSIQVYSKFNLFKHNHYESALLPPPVMRNRTRSITKLLKKTRN